MNGKENMTWEFIEKRLKAQETNFSIFLEGLSGPLPKE
jgi:hypothetical protein